MTKEKIYELSEAFAENSEMSEYERKNALYKGMHILSKYVDDLAIWVWHEEIWVGFNNEDDSKYEELSEEDLHQLFRCGFTWDSSYGDCFHKFL